MILGLRVLLFGLFSLSIVLTIAALNLDLFSSVAAED